MINDPILRLINSLRNCHSNFQTMFTNGYCFELFKIIHSVYPEAIPWYDQILGHIYTQVGQYWYDINGRYSHISDNAFILYQEKNILKKTHRWSEGSGWKVQK